jgi:predicted RNA-binding protein YlxR (DUF448 family)
VACRTARPKRELVRIVRTPAGEVRPDPSGRLAGRGAYVCQGGDCLTLAINRGALSRALEAPIPVELRSALLTALEPQHDHQGGARGQE